LVLLAIAVGVLAWLATRPVRIPREPAREGDQDPAASRAYDHTSRWPVFWLERWLVLRRLRKLAPRGVILDAGCGPGYLAAAIRRRFPGLAVIALDVNSEMLRLARANWPARQYPQLALVRGDVHCLPFGDSSLDTVVSSLSMHHWHDAVWGLNELVRVLRPGGRLLVLDARRDSRRFFYYAIVVGQALVAPRDIKRTNGAAGSMWAAYTPHEVEEMLRSLPIEDVRLEGRFGWLAFTGRKSGRQAPRRPARA
jgi:ubiquinone/menaquinone biosynthesis C-methylase UbiE